MAITVSINNLNDVRAKIRDLSDRLATEVQGQLRASIVGARVTTRTCVVCGPGDVRAPPLRDHARPSSPPAGPQASHPTQVPGVPRLVHAESAECQDGVL